MRDGEEFKLGFALGVEKVVVFFVLLVVEIVLEVDELGEGAKVLVARVVVRRVQHRVLTVLDEELHPLIVPGPSEHLRCHFRNF